MLYQLVLPPVLFIHLYYLPSLSKQKKIFIKQNTPPTPFKTSLFQINSSSCRKEVEIKFFEEMKICLRTIRNFAVASYIIAKLGFIRTRWCQSDISGLVVYYPHHGSERCYLICALRTVPNWLF